MKPSRKTVYFPRDANEREIIQAYQAIGAVVIQLDKFDLLVGYAGKWTVIEVKNLNGRNRPTPEQVKIFEQAKRVEAPAFVVTDIDQALQAVGAVW